MPVRINTRVVLDMATGAVLERTGFDYCGPVARCDRSVQNAANTAASTEGAQATGIGSYLTPLAGELGGGQCTRLRAGRGEPDDQRGADGGWGGE